MLTDRELERYRRQTALFGEDAQEQLKKAKVVIVGVGGLGCPAALYLAAAGIGEIRLVDGDVVDQTNLNRQVLHGDRDIGRAATMATLPVERQEDCSACGIVRC